MKKGSSWSRKHEAESSFRRRKHLVIQNIDVTLFLLIVARDSIDLWPRCEHAQLLKRIRSKDTHLVNVLDTLQNGLNCRIKIFLGDDEGRCKTDSKRGIASATSAEAKDRPHTY